MNAPGAQRPAVLIGSVSPQSTRLAGELADGVITTWAGPRAIAEVVVPTLGRPSRVVSGQLICVTPDVDEARRRIEELYGAAASRTRHCGRRAPTPHRRVWTVTKRRPPTAPRPRRPAGPARSPRWRGPGRRASASCWSHR
ncbi:LLM class flavin-dependent oxidoreductase [Amycolatopsis sp. lyj-346]|uniref:LLM class flavin-dependent oxidoreductase n=1 Tax=Amycolatopsis sp. lyj-346 TaxID=2789289 RepID=UPI003979612D